MAMAVAMTMTVRVSVRVRLVARAVCRLDVNVQSGGARYRCGR